MHVQLLRATLLSLCVVASSGAADAKGKAKAPVQRTNVSPETLALLESHTNVTYARYGDRELPLDLYRPKASKEKLPGIVCIHGGGWFQGNSASMRPLAQTLAAKGFVTVTINYRLSGEKQFPAAIEDCKAAVRWLRANAEKFGVRSDAIGATGLSAGGHLAALLATSGNVRELEGGGGNPKQSSTVQACVAMGAQSDFETERIRTLSSTPSNPHYRPFLGGTLDEIPQVYALASPRHHIDKHDPPLLFMSGELDDPSTHANEARADLEKLGIPTGYVAIPDAPHGFLGQQKAFDICVRECAAFFTKHLKEPRRHQ